ncbi:MAG TPA: MBL fold metallo-hydrolase [Armatimonadota bacterium]|nr:MBL fold metallo-hydrolase [Armatimonadota bacterium]
MVIKWLGHSSFLIISARGTKIITDPYEPGAFGGAVNYKPIGIPPDIVTVSHDHADHSYIEGLPNHFSVVAQPGGRSIHGIDFRGVESYHDTEQGALRGMNVIFVMNIDHVRVCHLGDQGQELSPQQAEQVGEVDILLIPVGGYYTIGPEEATRTIEQLNPRVAIPMHFRTDKVELPILPVDNFLQGKENVRILNSSELEITRETLPDQREIVVLEHAL